MTGCLSPVAVPRQAGSLVGSKKTLTTRTAWKHLYDVSFEAIEWRDNWAHSIQLNSITFIRELRQAWRLHKRARRRNGEAEKAVLHNRVGGAELLMIIAPAVAEAVGHEVAMRYRWFRLVEAELRLWRHRCRQRNTTQHNTTSGQPLETRLRSAEALAVARLQPQPRA